MLRALILVCCVAATAAQPYMVSNNNILQCPAVKNVLEVRAINAGDGTNTARLMWRAQPTVNNIRGVRYVDAHCTVNGKDEYNVRMAVASSTSAAPSIHSTDSTFVADLPLTSANDRASCWFTYELESTDSRVLACDSDSAFSFTGGAGGMSSSPSAMPMMASPGTGSIRVGGASSSSMWSSAPMSFGSNAFELPLLAASEVCPAINFQPRVLASPKQAGAVYIVFEAQSSRLGATPINLLSVDLHYHVKGALTNMHVQMQNVNAQNSAELQLSASPLIKITEPAIDLTNANAMAMPLGKGEIMYSFTYAVELPGRGRVDCDSEVFSATAPRTSISMMAGVDESELEGVDYVWVYDYEVDAEAGVNEQQLQQAPQYSTKWTQPNTQQFAQKVQPTQEQVPQQVTKQYITKAQPVLEQQVQQQQQVQEVTKQFITKAQPVQQQQQQVQEKQYIIKAQPIQEQQVQQQQIPVQQVTKQYITKAQPVLEQQQQTVQYVKTQPVQEQQKQYIVKAQPIMEQQVQQQIPVQQVTKQYITKAQPVLEQQQQTVQYVKSQPIQEQQKQYISKAQPVLEQQQQVQQQIPVQQVTKQYITKAQPIMEQQVQQQIPVQQVTKQYITKAQPVLEQQVKQIPVQQVQQQIPVQQVTKQFINPQPIQQQQQEVPQQKQYIFKAQPIMEQQQQQVQQQIPVQQVTKQFLNKAQPVLEQQVQQQIPVQQVQQQIPVQQTQQQIPVQQTQQVTQQQQQTQVPQAVQQNVQRSGN